MTDRISTPTPLMRHIHDFGASVIIRAEATGLTICGPNKLKTRENWPAEAIRSPSGWRTALEVEQFEARTGREVATGA